jgi:hypothetical protein
MDPAPGRSGRREEEAGRIPVVLRLPYQLSPQLSESDVIGGQQRLDRESLERAAVPELPAHLELLRRRSAVGHDSKQDHLEVVVHRRVEVGRRHLRGRVRGDLGDDPVDRQADQRRLVDPAAERGDRLPAFGDRHGRPCLGRKILEIASDDKRTTHCEFHSIRLKRFWDRIMDDQFGP